MDTEEQSEEFSSARPSDVCSPSESDGILLPLLLTENHSGLGVVSPRSSQSVSHPSWFRLLSQRCDQAADSKRSSGTQREPPRAFLQATASATRVHLSGAASGGPVKRRRSAGVARGALMQQPPRSQRGRRRLGSSGAGEDPR